MISVVVPAYNAEKYIENAIRSVTAQTFQNWELIVVDDCSSDATAAIVTKLAASERRIKLIHNEKNSGVAVSRNRGIAVAEGEWIALLDADDAWRPDKLQTVDDFCKAKPARFIFTGSAFMTDDGSSIDAYLSAPETIDFRRLCRQNIISCSSVVICRELLQKYPFPDDRSICEDFAVWLKILRSGITAYGIDEPLLVYRLTSSSRSADKLHAAGMTWRTYRHIGLSNCRACICFTQYVFRSLFKYFHLRRL